MDVYIAKLVMSRRLTELVAQPVLAWQVQLALTLTLTLTLTRSRRSWRGR